MPVGSPAVHPVATPARSDSIIPEVKEDSTIATCPTTKPAEVEAEVPTVPQTGAEKPGGDAMVLTRKAGLIRFDTLYIYILCFENLLDLCPQDSANILNTLQAHDFQSTIFIPKHLSQ